MKDKRGGPGGEDTRGGGRKKLPDAPHRRRSGGGVSGRLALIVAVLGLVLVVVFVIPRGRRGPGGSLPPASVVTSNPINATDPTSGKPVVPGITSVYKGYTIGHCCAQSRIDWENLSVERKEGFIRKYLG